jgi:carbon storage regulator
VDDENSLLPLTGSVQHVQLNEAGVRNASLAVSCIPIFPGSSCSEQRMVRAERNEHQRGEAMLVLSRKKNESIIINDNITVTVIEIRGDKVRLGIEAPKDVTVHRREVYEAIQNQARGLDQGAKVVRPEA